MPTYSYTGTTRDGVFVEGVVEAFDELEAMERARENVSVVRSVEKVRKNTGILSMNITAPNVKAKDLSVICSQFSIILRAGMPIARAVALVADQAENKYLHQVLTDVAQDVASGHSLAESLQNKGEYLPKVLVETVRAGEESGHLPESFSRLQHYFDRRSKVAAKVSQAITYPIFVCLIAVVVVIVMMVAVVPAIAGMVSSMGAEMPGITQFLINSSNFISSNIILIAIVIALLVAGIYSFGRTDRGKMLYSRAALRIPIIGKINVSSAAAQFANTMSTLVSAGLPITRAVETTGRVIKNEVLSRQISSMLAGLEEGRTLGECMELCPYFPRTLVEMITVGEQTGELEETLETMGEFFDDETKRMTDKALSLLEPTLLVLLAVFAGFIVIALYLPLFTMYANM